MKKQSVSDQPYKLKYEGKKSDNSIEQVKDTKKVIWQQARKIEKKFRQYKTSHFTSLIYTLNNIFKAARAMSAGDSSAILSTCRQLNEERHITGILLYIRGKLLNHLRQIYLGD